ncbi:putative secreted protein [Planktothrix serta PCC 8927]|uniref:Secreted protein n=1 Tax=Planktothrix serta PCC 8927 TaxID=671068 RepID=A0A7Z9BKD1_9CYAN|nr:phosphate/phosphite/phosphonate ABC transporter substrate-binding protein [Planktothrix serta]VXD14035.1 putative secreted protein [Planktothrix serta PCC 8927]
MLNKILGNLLLLGVVTLTVACTQTSPTPSAMTPTATPTGTKTLVIGDVTNQPAKKITRYQPLADYLAAHLSQFGIGVGEVKVAPDVGTMAEFLKSGQVDLYFDSPYPAMIATNKSGAQAILRRWKGGDAIYRTIIFSLKDTGIERPEDLKGRMMAFDDVTSTSGFVLPFVYLKEKGLKLKGKDSTTDEVASDEVGYVFSQDDQNNIQWVISGKVDAAAVDHRSYLDIPEQSRNAMVILGETEEVARHVVLIRSGLPPEQVEAIKQIMVAMDQTPEGKAVLEQFEETAKFDAFPTQKDIARMQELYEQVQNR